MAISKRRGKWVLDFYDQHGNRRWETTEGNKKEAEELLGERLKAVRTEDYVSPKERKVPFTKFANEWLGSREGKIRPATIEQYRDHINKHLSPYFGSILIGRIKLTSVENYIKHKEEEKSLGVATINKTVTTLGTIFKSAVIKNLMDSNPVTLVERPKQDAREHSEDKENNVLTPQQIRAFLAEAKPGLYGTLFTTAIMTGMRQEELLALRWGDIDWVRGQVQVRRALSRNGGEWRFYAPKTKTSRRNIDVDPALLLELKKWRLKLGKSEPEDLVFPSPSGSPMHRSTLHKQGFQPALRKSGVPLIRFHDLRHTYASLLIAQGEHPKYIQVQMGHSSINVTMDVYGHLMDQVNVASANRLAKTVFGEAIGENGSKSVAG